MSMFDMEGKHSSASYWKPDRYTTYKAKIGKFVSTSKKDEDGNKEEEEYDTLKLTSIVVLYKAKAKDYAISVKAPLYGPDGIYGGGEILYFDDTYRKLGFKKLEKAEFKSKTGTYQAWAVDGNKIEVEACIIGILPNGLSTELTIAGSVFKDIFWVTQEMKDNKINKNPKSEAISKNNTITFKPQANTVSVGQASKKADIYLLDVEGSNEIIEGDILEQCTDIFNILKEEINQKKQDEYKTELPARNYTEMSLENVPF